MITDMFEDSWPNWPALHGVAPAFMATRAQKTFFVIAGGRRGRTLCRAVPLGAFAMRLGRVLRVGSTTIRVLDLQLLQPAQQSEAQDDRTRNTTQQHGLLIACEQLDQRIGAID
jgi:hypothetical protein